MREVITRARLEKLGDRQELTFPEGTIFTQAARELIREKGIKINLVPQKSADEEKEPRGPNPEEKEINRAIVTVIGHDKVGIIAAVSSILAGVNVNILDITQTVLQGFFAMIMIVDLSKCKVDFLTLKKMLEEKGEELELRITLQHEDVFRFMHRI
ncbi:MAG: ACT domain-containing protein [Thermoanaerobacterales bacterium 50_218]|nr:MAG: ACT domain-containing protein [Thermoanaerobacterales bacterium 50_218]